MELHARGVQAWLPENSSDVVCVFFFCVFLFYSIIGLFQRKLEFSKVSEGVQHFPGLGGPTFSRVGGPTFTRVGPNANFYRNP